MGAPVVVRAAPSSRSDRGREAGDCAGDLHITATRVPPGHNTAIGRPTLCGTQVVLHRHAGARGVGAEQASEKRALVVAQRGNTRDAVADSLEERKVAATNLRKTNKLVKKEAARRRKQGQQFNAMAADIYRSRFASKEAAAAYDSSEWMNLTAWFVPRDPPPVEQPRLTQKAPEEAAAEEAEGASLEA